MADFAADVYVAIMLGIIVMAVFAYVTLHLSGSGVRVIGQAGMNALAKVRLRRGSRSLLLLLRSRRVRKDDGGRRRIDGADPVLV